MAYQRPHLRGGSTLPCPFNPQQMVVLSSICDALIPSIKLGASTKVNGWSRSADTSGLHHPANGEKESSEKQDWTRARELEEFFALSGAENGVPEEAAGLATTLGPKTKILSTVLTLLSWSLGTLLLAGRLALDWRFPFVHPFSALPREVREKVLQSWATSTLQDLRALFAAFKALTMFAFYAKVDEKGHNPTWAGIGYTGPDPQRTVKAPAKGSNQRPLEDAVVNAQEVLAQGGDLAKLLRDRGFEASSTSADISVDCDVVIVGSGSGGGVVAGQLAQAGHKVLVVEKGAYFSRDDLSLLELPSLQNMYERGGICSTDDGGVAILAGSTVGGGSAINWAASFKTQPHVLREWVEDLGLTKFGGAEYQEAMETVCRRGGVQTEKVVHNLQNEVLRRGCQKLGLHVGVIPRNVDGEHQCGWCGMGCANGDKKATSETWLVDAAKAGALILSCVQAHKVLLEPNRDPRSDRQFRARGVEAQIGNRRLTIHAKATVSAAGALHTPAFLLRSGLTNPNIGKHLHVHPVSVAWGYFPEGEGPPGRMYEGAIMTAYSREVANWDTSGYGTLLMVASTHPALASSNLPWTSGLDSKQRMARYDRTIVLIAICRDQSGGHVTASKAGHPVIDYWPGKADQEHLRKGAEYNLRVLAAAGAHEVGTCHATGPRFTPAVPGTVDQHFETWVQSLRQLPFEKLKQPVGSAHQMGSCRMGVHPSESAVDEACESWEAAGLFLGDASVFPTATGTNPMITVQSIAYCTSQAIKARLAEGRLNSPVE